MYKSILNILQELEKKLPSYYSFPRCHHPFTSLTSPALVFNYNLAQLLYITNPWYKVIFPLHCQILRTKLVSSDASLLLIWHEKLKEIE